MKIREESEQGVLRIKILQQGTVHKNLGYKREEVNYMNKLKKVDRIFKWKIKTKQR